MNQPNWVCADVTIEPPGDGPDVPVAGADLQEGRSDRRIPSVDNILPMLRL